MSKTDLNSILISAIAPMLWGLTVIVSYIVPQYNAFQLAAGRYWIFGALCALLMLINFRKYKGLFSRKLIVVSMLLSGVLVIYYIMYVLALKYTDNSLPLIILSFSPLICTFADSLQSTTRPNLKRLVPPIFLVIGGTVLANLSSAPSGGKQGFDFVGLLLSILVTALWSLYIIATSRYLKKAAHIPPSLLNNTVGIGAAIVVSLFVLIAQAVNPAIFGIAQIAPAAGTALFWICVLMLALIPSLLAFFMWNKGSKRLPLSLSGQLLALETLFGIIYMHIYKLQVPSWTEVVSVLAVFAGIIWSIRNISYKPKPKVIPPSTTTPNPAHPNCNNA